MRLARGARSQQGAHRDDRLFRAAYAALCPFLLAPLFAAELPPALDLPFHLALADMLAKARDAASPYAPFYAPRFWPPLPSLPWLLLARLGAALGPLLAAKALLAAAALAWPLCVASLARAWGGARTPALFAAALGFNLALHYGFLGYALSMPVVLMWLAAIARPLATGSLSGRDVVGIALASLLTFSLHLEGFVLGFGASVAMAALAGGSLRPRALALAATLPSALIAFGWQRAAQTENATPHGLAATFVDLATARRAKLGDASVLHELLLHFDGLRVHLLRGFRDRHDIVASTVLLALVLAMALASRTSQLRARLTSTERRLRFAALLTMAGAYYALPHHWPAYDAMTVSPRVVPLVVGVLIASVPIAPDWADGAPAPRRRLLVAVPLLFSAVYAVVVTVHYRRYGEETRDALAVLRRVPPGGRLVGLVFGGDSRVMSNESLLVALPSLYVALDPHPRSFVALRYCGMRHVACERRGPSVAAPDPWAPERVETARVRREFDYAVVRHDGSTLPSAAEAVVARASQLAKEGSWSAYRLAP